MLIARLQRRDCHRVSGEFLLRRLGFRRSNWYAASIIPACKIRIEARALPDKLSEADEVSRREPALRSENSAPFACTASSVHDFTALPSSNHRHAPQILVSHPTCVPVVLPMSREKIDQQQTRSTHGLARDRDLEGNLLFWHRRHHLPYISISPRGFKFASRPSPCNRMRARSRTRNWRSRSRHKREKGKDASIEGEKPCQDRKNSPPPRCANSSGQRSLIDISPIEDLNRRVTHRNRQSGSDPIFRAGCSASNEELKRLPIYLS